MDKKRESFGERLIFIQNGIKKETNFKIRAMTILLSREKNNDILKGKKQGYGGIFITGHVACNRACSCLYVCKRVYVHAITRGSVRVCKYYVCEHARGQEIFSEWVLTWEGDFMHS